jgi:hypothetical protein
MASVVQERSTVGQAPKYQHALKSGTVAIGLVGGVLAGCAVVSAVMTAPRYGLVLLVVAAVVAALDARYATVTHIAIDERGVTLGYWKRTKTFAPKSVSILHDVPRGRLTLSRRGKKRTLARFRDPRGTAVRAAMGAGVEVISY